MKDAWKWVEPGTEFADNWHIELICKHLEAITRGEFNRLIINVPPGTMKSLLVCVFWQPWVWTERPEKKWMFASYNVSLSKRDNLRARRLIESPWYQACWGHVYKPVHDEWLQTRYVNNRAGFRMCTGVGGGATGEHVDYQVVDDPHKPSDLVGVSRPAIETTKTWWQQTMASRLLGPRSSRVIIMQRLHKHDLAGICLESGQYEHLCLPMVYESSQRSETSVGKDKRRREGELLWPKLFSKSEVAKRKEEFGSRGWAAQDQQRPSPPGGA